MTISRAAKTQAARVITAAALTAAVTTSGTAALAAGPNQPERHAGSTALQTRSATSDKPVTHGVTMTSRSTHTQRAALHTAAETGPAKPTKPEPVALAEATAQAQAKARAAATPAYANNLDGWIREARDVMADHGIPGSYDGIKRNIIRESGGDPNVVNTWDINAQNGTPSTGLLQVIKPTFDEHHVDGTAHDLTDPVANIAAACAYAAERYGSIDNVDSAY